MYLTGSTFRLAQLQLISLSRADDLQALYGNSISLDDYLHLNIATSKCVGLHMGRNKPHMNGSFGADAKCEL